MTAPAAPRIGLTPPPGFAGLPLTGPASGTEAVEAVAARMAGPDTAPAAELAACLAVLGEWLRPHHVQLFGKFAVDTPSAPALATLTVAVIPLANPARLSPAELVPTLARRAHGSAGQARVVTLNCGPAVATLVHGEFVLPAAGADARRPVLRAEFRIPTPHADHLVVLSVSADTGTGWAPIAEAAVRVANSVRFAEADR